MTLSLTGCRESLKIAKIIHDQKVQEKDDDLYLAENTEESEVEDESLPDLKEDKSEKKNNEESKPVTYGTQKNSTTAPKTVHSSDSSKNTKAQKSGSNKGPEKSESKNKKGTGGSGSSKSGDSKAGKGGDRQIYDDDGNVIDLPEEVNSVVAAGDAALIAQMLGGSNVLSGTSANVAGDGMIQSVFADEGISEASAYWEGDGSSPMSSAQFNAMLKSKPDVCIASGGRSSFSSSQVAKLKKKGIAYVTIPAMDTPEHIKKAVSIVGKMLGNRSKKSGGVNAKALASEYADYCDDLAGDVRKAVGNSADSCFTLYVGWDESASFIMPEISYQEDGVAFTSPFAARPLDHYLETGGVKNNSSKYRSSMQSDGDHAVIPLNINYENNVQVTNGLALLRNTDNNSFVRNSSCYLGNSKFKWIIADSQYTKGCLESSKGSDGMWTSFGQATASSGGTSVTDYGFAVGGHLVRTNIRGSYNVVVNPYGVGSWAEGSPESVLECIWAAWRIAGVYSKADVKNEIKYFYKTFYRCDLTNSQIEAILEGI